jgi:hypothetical protein
MGKKRIENRMITSLSNCDLVSFVLSGRIKLLDLQKEIAPERFRGLILKP